MLATKVPEPECFSIDEAIETPLSSTTLIRLSYAASLPPSRHSSRMPVGAEPSGYMQIMPATAEELGYDASDKQQNIQAGSKYLASCIEKYKGARNGTSKSHCGVQCRTGNVDRYKGVPPFRETRKYVKRVLEYHAEFAEGESSSSEGL